MDFWNGLKPQPLCGNGEVAGLPGVARCGSKTSGQNVARCDAFTVPLEFFTVMCTKFLNPFSPSRTLAGNEEDPVPESLQGNGVLRGDQAHGRPGCPSLGHCCPERRGCCHRAPGNGDGRVPQPPS